MSDQCSLCYAQVQISGGTTSTVLHNLHPDTLYTISVVPVYPETEGKRQSEKGRTSEWAKLNRFKFNFQYSVFRQILGRILSGKME